MDDGTSTGPARRCTLIFSKQPAPGRVKTRLCPPLEPSQAARLALGMLDDAVARCLGSAAFRTGLRYAPESDAEPAAGSSPRAWFRERYPQLRDQAPQRGAGLGRRLASAFAEELERADTDSVVVIGSDAPWLDADRIERAHAALEHVDLVLGPDAGGGYYLVGLARPCAALFLEVGMSTPSMYRATLEVARARGLSFEELPAGYDVDDGADLERLRRDLEHAALAPNRPVATELALREIYERTDR